MADSPLPKPDSWKPAPVALTIGLAMVFGFGVFSAYWAARYAAESVYPTALVDAGLAVGLFASAAALVIMQLGWVKIRCDTSDGFTVLRPDPVVLRLLALSLIALFPASVAVAVMAPNGALGWTMTARELGKVELGAIVMALGAGGGLVAMAVALARRWQRSIRLSPHGFEFREWKHSAGSWDDVADLVAGTARGYPIVFVTRSSGSRLFSSAAQYTPHGRALFWMLRHYWEHPEDRAELSDHTACERLREQRFDTT